ncbi:DUF1844 domain-containing protein [Blastopirellula marina]|uniref:DUF1844 domain-containing protein n=1 Tax=Blastopirellula marina DSM 3645 TaxID=314230 RepID=A3ZYL3_9BACT|nr:DUF1844 domain-containing protein [Blastopirellula marina]EAQ78468.1 hypothetical protein DSM3645_07246 [Blastopirellula marina DSM 3645]
MTDDSEAEKKIIVDSDWKEQVEQEKEKLRAEDAPEATPAAEEPVAAAPTDSDSSAKFDPSKLPPPDFRMLISMLATQAFAAMGQIPHPETGQAMVELPLAKHMIDLLGVIEEKTKGNLSPDEAEMIEHALHDLRMGYFAMSQQAPK